LKLDVLVRSETEFVREGSRERLKDRESTVPIFHRLEKLSHHVTMSIKRPPSPTPLSIIDAISCNPAYDSSKHIPSHLVMYLHHVAAALAQLEIRQ
jgi:hypothetical protein